MGETTARLLARRYGTAEWFRKAMFTAARDRKGDAFTELDNIEGIGPTVAEAIADFFAEPHNVRSTSWLSRSDLSRSSRWRRPRR